MGTIFRSIARIVVLLSFSVIGIFCINYAIILVEDGLRLPGYMLFCIAGIITAVGFRIGFKGGP